MTDMISDPKPEVFEVEPDFLHDETVPRPDTLDMLTPFQAALAVGDFLGTPQRRGEWLLDTFKIDEEGMLVDYIRAHGDMGRGRWSCGVGTFHKLAKVHPGAGWEGAPGEEMWMSNTPQEIIDHEHPLERATGRVLVHGLGLSCIVSGLLAKDDIEHIDVVELDPDVIALVGPAYDEEKRVTIHQGNCLTFDWPESTRWNYVWHDIWATIGPKNLLPETAENGISYGMLHERFEDMCDMQRSWQMETAHKMARIEKEIEAKRDQFETWWITASFEERADRLIDFRVEEQLNVPGFIEGHSRDEMIEIMEHLDQLEPLFILASQDEAPRLL